MSKVKNIYKDFKNFDLSKLYAIQSYILVSKDFFKDFDDIIFNTDLSDSDKILYLKNKKKEFDSNVCL